MGPQPPHADPRRQRSPGPRPRTPPCPEHAMTRKTITWSAVTAVAIAVAVALAARAKTQAPIAAGANDPKPAAVNLAEVKTVRSAPREEITGALNPAKELKTGFEVPGRLARILVKKGAPVAEGQVIAQLDPEIANAQVQQAEA